MQRFKTALLLATAASCALASTSAFAQVAPGPNDGDNALHGTGATSIQTLLTQELNCTGATSNQLGNANNTFTTVPEPTNLITGPSTSTSTFNCVTQSKHANFNGKYVGTGSGFGRQAWRNVTAQFSNTPGTGNNNPFQLISGQSAWSHVQFAFADSSITAQDLTDYTSNGVASIGGAAIMVPKFVLPVALAYNPVYGTNNLGQPMSFNVVSPGTTYGGIKLNTADLCAIWNGTKTNWNQIATGPNGGTKLFDPTNDTQARWDADGVPIRLVGRMDNSGTTDVFTRALAAQCGGTRWGAAGNHAEALPYDKTVSGSAAISFTAERADTPYFPGSGSTFASSDPSVGKEFWSTTSNSIQISANSGALAVSSNPVGNSGSGRFLLANGSGSVAAAIAHAPDYTNTSSTFSSVTLNGKIGYIGGDFLANSPSGNANLFAAALQSIGNPAVFVVPSAATALQAFGGVQPPQSAAAGTGVYDTSQPGNRAAPLDWYNRLYPTTGPTLAAPTAGYRITGTTQLLAYTCYQPNNAANILAWVPENFDDPAVPNVIGGIDRVGIFTGTTGEVGFGYNGLLARSNIGPMPFAWRHAVNETFLKNSTESSGGHTLGSLGLFIEGAGPSSAHCTTVGTLPGASAPGI